MLEFVRSHQRLMQVVLFLLVAPPFIFFGVRGFDGIENAKGVAKVNGQVISQQEFDEAQRQRMQRAQAMMGPAFDPKMLDTPEARRQIIDQLIQQHVLQTQAVKDRLSVSQEKVGQTISEIPAVHALYRPDGTLDSAAYDALLAQNNTSRDELFARVRNDLLMQQISNTIPESTVVPKAALDRLNALYDQQRSVSEQVFAPSDYLAKVSLPADAAKKYYDAHSKDFVLPESVDVQYLQLDQNAVQSHVTVTPDEEKAYYDANKMKFNVPEQRRASHILIAVPKDAPQVEKDKLKAKAQDILAKVRANPKDFAELAKKYSDDPGSAQRGGDLDWAPAENYVKPFSDALFALKPDQISDLVETEFGYHIIELTGVRPGGVRPLDEVKGEIDAELQKQKASAIFSQSAEDFSNIVYDQPDSLQPAATKMGLTLQTANGLTRTPDAKNQSPVSNPKVLDALFAPDSLKLKHNTAAIEVSPGVLISARIVADHPAVQQPFDQVKDAITKKLTDEAAQKLAQDAGAARLAALQKGLDDAGFSPPKVVSRFAPQGLSADAIKTVFSADASKLPAYIGETQKDGGYAIYRVSDVVTNVPQTARLQDGARAAQLSKQAGQLEFASYLEALKKRMKVMISANEPAASENSASTTP